MINKYLKALLTVLVFAFTATQSFAATVGFNTSVSAVNQGDAFSLTIQGSDFGSIVGGGLNLSYDASVLQINSVTINQSVFEFYIGGGTEEGVIDNSLGQFAIGIRLPARG